MEIKIAVAVGSNGEYAVGKFEGGDTDWPFISDSLGVYDETTREMKYPTTEVHYIVTAEVASPRTETVQGSVTKAITS